MLKEWQWWLRCEGEVVVVVVCDELAMFGDMAVCFVIHSHPNSTLGG